MSGASSVVDSKFKQTYVPKSCSKYGNYEIKRRSLVILYDRKKVDNRIDSELLGNQITLYTQHCCPAHGMINWVLCHLELDFEDIRLLG